MAAQWLYVLASSPFQFLQTHVFSQEGVGYLASLFVAVSLSMKSMLPLRILNLVGALLFVIYGLLINAYPVAVVNAYIAVINVIYLWKQRSADPKQKDVPLSQE